MQVTIKEAEEMPAGAALNNLIQEHVFKATALTDDEFALVRAVWLRNGPQWAQNARPFKVPLSRTQIENLKASHIGPWTIDPEVVPCYDLCCAQDYSANDWGARAVVSTMRNNGWLYEFAEMDHGKLRSVRFRRVVWKSGELPDDIIALAYAGTDELAICRAALVAEIKLSNAIARGYKTEGDK